MRSAPAPDFSVRNRPGVARRSEDPAVANLVNEIAEGVASTAIEVTVGALQGMQSWSQGIQPTRETATWNSADQAWILSHTENFDDEDVNGTIDLTWWVQFRADGVPIQEPGEILDEMVVRLDAHYAGNHHPGDFTTDFDWDVAYENSANLNVDESVSFVGSGTLTGETSTLLNDHTYNHQQNVTWGHNLTAAPGEACVSGNVEGVWDAFEFNGTFNGAGRVDWTVHSGDELIVSDYQTYDCDPQPN